MKEQQILALILPFDWLKTRYLPLKFEKNRGFGTTFRRFVWAKSRGCRWDLGLCFAILCCVWFWFRRIALGCSSRIGSRSFGIFGRRIWRRGGRGRNGIFFWGFLGFVFGVRIRRTGGSVWWGSFGFGFLRGWWRCGILGVFGWVFFIFLLGFGRLFLYFRLNLRDFVIFLVFLW